MACDVVMIALLVTFLALWWVCFELFDRDLASPALLVMSGYTICVVVAFVAGFTIPHEYSAETFFVLLAGTLLFLAPSYVAHRLYGKPRAGRLSPRIIRLHPLALWFIAGMSVVCLVLTLRVFAGIVGGYSLGETIATMRFSLIENPDLATTPALVAVSQLKKCLYIVSFFLLFVWARNAAVRKRFWGDKLILMNLSLSVLLLLTEGGRSGVVAFVCGGATLWFVFDRLINGTRLALSGRLLLKGFAAMTVASVVFVGMLLVLGRGAQAGDHLELATVWSQFQIYIGAPIPLLDDFLRNTASVLGGG